MLRRDFLRLTALTPLAALSVRSHAFPVSTGRVVGQIPDGRPHRLELKAHSFMLDGKPMQIRSGEMHPARIPAEYWLHRIRMAKAMGLNTISIYLMWNHLEREPGVFDLHTGNRDFVQFIRLCQREGMWVYLRPGPYICGEWDYGGLPPYLLRKPDIRVRNKDDPDYMAAVQRYIDAIAPLIHSLMAYNGGPVLMLQVENEYASFGHDLDYLKQLQALWEAHGIRGPFTISDGLGQLQQQHTYPPGTALGLDGDTDFATAQTIAGEAPVWVGEGYPGWLTHWGDPDFQRGDYVATLRELLQQGRSFNLYVVHGGSNFGFSAGANAKGDYSHFEPVITSYDYGAPINERGEATPDYHAFRALLAEHATQPLSDVPAPPAAIRFAAITPVAHASLWDNLPAPRAAKKPQANELLFAQDHGLVLYRRKIPAAAAALTLDGVRDYATVFSDGHYVDYVSRVQHAKLRAGNRVELPVIVDGKTSQLDVLVDSFGHVGYGQAMADRKGIVGSIRLGNEEVEDWNVYSLPLDEGYIRQLKPVVSEPSRPGIFFKATLRLDQLGDSYIDMSGWAKGYLWVNGQLLGRYWNLGPQQRLYCPASWFRLGDNELMIFDLHQTVAAPMHGATTLHA
ncbi:beta-galactosidase [Rhodanobacter sp. C03]|uniref:beta-galactosidase n=1 Tax=Rhodanobacter sp. C03 TaxID=1945858 RepID=UPI000984C035|nr:beta-galactosidase [Rhodanobacter sp. C03]OOG60146.1 beta-galactosidase [Rhodanobacter sp. C03]